MLGVVLDTNILISATIRRGNQFNLLMLGKLGQIKIITSPQILSEVEEVLKRAKFEFSAEHIAKALSEIKSITYLVYPNEKVNVVKEDPDDDAIIECALAGKADYIISGDGDLLNLKEYKGIKIRNYQDFIQETNL